MDENKVNFIGVKTSGWKQGLLLQLLCYCADNCDNDCAYDCGDDCECGRHIPAVAVFSYI